MEGAATADAMNGSITRPEQSPVPGSCPGSRGVSLSGSIAERRAAKCGFNVAQISTARFRMSGSLPSLGGSGTPSPCLTIPPGISPTALLDSPIMLPNSQLSPTTGTFSFPPFLDDSPILRSDDEKGSSEDSSAIAVRPPSSPVYLTGFPELGEDQETTAHDRDFLPGNNLMHFEIQPNLPQDHKKFPMNSPSSEEVFGTPDLKPIHMGSEVSSGNDSGGPALMEKEFVQEEGGGTQDGDPKVPYNALGLVKTSEDGYNWRKYGQKQVKGSEYPRSYYKCTNPNCQVKKKVERFHDGQITEIIYKGAHNHPKPQLPRRGATGPVYSLTESMPEIDGGSRTVTFNTEGGPVRRNVQVGHKDVKPVGLEGTSPTSVITEISDPLSSTPPGKGVGVFESEHTPELSSMLASHDDEEDGALFSALEEADDDEPESKRRKSENCFVDSSLASRAVREPRVVIQIESEIDILDDGYRWRKYGQKVVKGNPNPRSYYKCTSAGCSVRKHVERASHDLKYVITTYEGKHNHEVPAARNSGAGNGNPSGGGNLGPLPPPHSQSSALAIPRNPNIVAKPESQVQDLMLFDRKPEFGTEFLRSASLLTNFGNEMKFGASSMYPVKFTPLRSCGSFGLGPGPSPIPQARSMTSVVPDFPSSLPFKFNQPTNIPLTSLDYNGKASGLARSFLSGQQMKEKDVRFLTPKQEQKDDHFYDSSFPIMDPASASPAAMFPQALVGFP
ncbi:probable WRKY transcription factor 20 [Punica granatum]|uniref:WRKY domain-containing protein n=2 Tax=Punica granatum TaxID=22663 RepID=A0A218XMB3_PUNGR|nr:probable WRKY transcription factor 20 [Punica granatum]OWM86137.1 hypothetical protein CDL15_Pgr010961 [Punica granatum]PKI66895.1 hypothetical protein CRG98_012658 [Punica granatum]